MNANQLERYSFLYSQARLLIAAVALFLGGVPVLRFLVRTPSLYGTVGTVLTITWILSGVASAYLLYRWMMNGQRLFGGKAQMDTAAFLVSVVSGINLGLVGLLGRNIGMSIAAGRIVFLIVGVIYIAAAYQLQMRWQATGKKLF